MTSSFFQSPHRRRNALTGDWVSVSPHRTARPWQGKVEREGPKTRPSHDPKCYLCAGNTRANGEHNPHYSSTFAFDNDFAAFLPQASVKGGDAPELLMAQSSTGRCRVLCFSARHDLTLAEMPIKGICQVVDLWIAESEILGRTWKWVQIFENKGEIMGCSNPHPHGQIWATDFIPNEPSKEAARQKEYFVRHSRPLLLDYGKAELERGDRVVVSNADWSVVVPWWALWPFETIVIPHTPCSRLIHLETSRRESLAEILKRLLVGYDALFETSFPYSMGWHGAPFDSSDHPEWTVHAHFFPPLLRSASVKKFMVGFEMLGEAQRDLTPEHAAEKLRTAICQQTEVLA